MGTTALRRVQFGRETTWGTSVAAAAVMSGISDFKFNPGVTVTQKRYLSGSLQPAQTASVTKKQPKTKLKPETGRDIWIRQAGRRTQALSGRVSSRVRFERLPRCCALWSGPTVTSSPI